MAKQKKNTYVQAKSDAAIEADLRFQLLRLKELPKDFRDLPVGGKRWQDFYNLVPAKRAEMTAWTLGPVFLIGSDLDEYEKLILGEKRIVIRMDKWKTFDVASLSLIEELLELAYDAELTKCSLLYIKDLQGSVVRGMNLLLAYFKWNIRFQTIIKKPRRV